MSGDTLILNSDGNPLSIIPLSVLSWQDAIRLLYLDKVIAVENYDNWTVHSSRLAMSVPAVVMTKKFHENANRVRFTRQNLYFRDDGKCQYCGEHVLPKDITMDHVVPRSAGGKKVWTNIVLACGPCNWERGSNVKIKPRRAPKKPTYYELVNHRKKFPITISHESWKDFLNWDESLVVQGTCKEIYSFHSDHITSNPKK